MQNKREQLILATKHAVGKYGISGVTTKNISDEAGINDSHLYRFFKNKEELLCEAYKWESTPIIENLIKNLQETKGIPLDFKTRIRLHFHRTWMDLISDPVRLTFLVYYYHSKEFEAMGDFHQDQTKELVESLGYLFEDREMCIRTLYASLTLMYDMAKHVTDTESADREKEEEYIFRLVYQMLLTCGVKEM